MNPCKFKFIIKNNFNSDIPNFYISFNFKSVRYHILSLNSQIISLQIV